MNCNIIASYRHSFCLLKQTCNAERVKLFEIAHRQLGKGLTDSSAFSYSHNDSCFPFAQPKMRSRQDRVLRCHHLREDANILTPLLFCEKHTQPLLGFHCGEIKLLGSVLSFKGAWKLKTGVLPRMCYPYTSGVIKGFPHNLQRKSGTP